MRMLKSIIDLEVIGQKVSSLYQTLLILISGLQINTTFAVILSYLSTNRLKNITVGTKNSNMKRVEWRFNGDDN